MEFASVFRRFGSEVTVIEYLKECLPALDSDIAKRLRKYLEKQGITFKMKTAVENIADIDADVILMATGRKPRTEGYTNVDENFQVLTVPEPAERAVPVERTVPEPVESNGRFLSLSNGRFLSLSKDYTPSATSTAVRCSPMPLRCRPSEP